MQRQNITTVLYLFLGIIISATTASCTVDKTDYEEETSTEVSEYYDFEEAVSYNYEHYKISIAALNGTFYKGHNDLRITIDNTQTNSAISSSGVRFLPILTNEKNNNTSCPHDTNLVYNASGSYYSGYAVFTDISSISASWKLYISFSENNKYYTTVVDINVKEQTNKNLGMTAFSGNDGKPYYIALIAPQKPEIAENDLVAGIYVYNEPETPAVTFPDPTQFSYSKVNNFTLLLDPRMPESSMGNHSSPNNKDLTQRDDGHYQGVVNYTMTGNWTLNFILLNQDSEVIKGTKVPTDFTPGVEGTKSELYIDILF